jgi:hypothetical protein
MVPFPLVFHQERMCHIQHPKRVQSVFLGWYFVSFSFHSRGAAGCRTSGSEVMVV